MISWERVIHSSPMPGKIYNVRYGSGESEPFKAWFSEDRIWRRIDPDCDGDGASELGPRLPNTNILYFAIEK